MTEDEKNAMDSYLIWWKREDACRFGNQDGHRKWDFHCIESVSLGEGLCTPTLWL